MDVKYGLLREDQVFGEQKIEVIDAVGAVCEATDLAILTGTDAGGKQDSGAGGKWFLSSQAGYGDVCVVSPSGKRAVAYTSACSGVRPVLFCEAAAVSGNIVKDISGFSQALYGEYPMDAADRELSRALEGAWAEGRLRKTGKVYRTLPREDAAVAAGSTGGAGSTEGAVSMAAAVTKGAGKGGAGGCPEYTYEGGKFVRVPCANTHPGRLSDGRTRRTGDMVWIRVSPVRWLYDAKAGLMLCRRILLDGVRFDSRPAYDGNFDATEMCGFLNTSFCEDLKPSEVGEMSPEEAAAYEEEARRAAKRRNPYGLTFGQVSEEDIIRGAIESDVPVFLHGPSSEGKSARVKQIDPTCEIIYLRNATPDSLNGRSVYNQTTGEMIDIPPTWYKKVVAKCEAEPDRFHVVFFDEINNALPGIQGMAFNIVLDREVNGLWKLPPNARVVAAGNDMQDSLAANQIAAPFFNRFAHVYINTTTDKWLRWARENHIHPAIYSYIAYRRGETLRSRYDGERPNADPRKWEMASRMLYATGRPEMLRALIGEEITDEFVQFCNQPVITLEDVLKGNYTDREIEGLNTAQRYATTMGLSQAGAEEAETVRAFLSKLGEEFRAVFDSLPAPEDRR